MWVTIKTIRPKNGLKLILFDMYLCLFLNYNEPYFKTLEGLFGSQRLLTQEFWDNFWFSYYLNVNHMLIDFPSKSLFAWF
jgi:hypothetical protein